MEKKNKNDLLKKMEKEVEKILLENENIPEEELEAKIMQSIFPGLEDLMDEDMLDEETKKQIEADNLLQEAYDAETESEAKKLAKQALKLDPTLVDAEALLIELEPDIMLHLKQYEQLKEKAKQLLQSGDEDYFSPENIGSFWGLFETRPYMRICHSYMLTLMHLGRFTEAIEQGEELLTLCESDNMGIRDIIMRLYVMLEKFDEAEKLHKKYKGSEMVAALLPLAIMYYKKGELEEAEKILDEIQEMNQYLLKEFVKMIQKGGEIDFQEREDYIEFGSKQEAILAIQDNMSLIMTVPFFIEFLQKYIKKSKKDNKKDKGNGKAHLRRIK